MARRCSKGTNGSGLDRCISLVAGLWSLAAAGILFKWFLPEDGRLRVCSPTPLHTFLGASAVAPVLVMAGSACHFMAIMERVTLG